MGVCVHPLVYVQRCRVGHFDQIDREIGFGMFASALECMFQHIGATTFCTITNGCFEWLGQYTWELFTALAQSGVKGGLVFDRILFTPRDHVELPIARVSVSIGRNIPRKLSVLQTHQDLGDIILVLLSYEQDARWSPAFVSFGPFMALLCAMSHRTVGMLRWPSLVDDGRGRSSIIVVVIG